MPDPIFHKFVVYSRFNSDGSVAPKIVQCNNCGVCHRVLDLCSSEIIQNMEDAISTISVSDLRVHIPEKVSSILDTHKCDIATWEQMSDVFENKEWGSIINLSTQKFDDSSQIKTLLILGEDSYKIEAHIRKDEIDVK